MNRVTIVMYHYTRDLGRSRYPEIKGLDKELFRSQLEFFAGHYHVITMEQLIEAVQSGDYEALPGNAMLLTFDDGYIDNYTVAMPLLQEYGMQGSFFIPGMTLEQDVLLDVNRIHFILATAGTDDLKHDLIELINQERSEGALLPTVEELYAQYAKPGKYDGPDTVFCKRVLQSAIPESYRNKFSGLLFEKYVGVTEAVFARELYLNKDLVRVMRRNGMFIGLHGYNHYWLGKLPAEEMRADLTRALESMQEFIDPDQWVMNFPYGSYNDEALQFIKDHGAVLGLSTNVDVADLGCDDPYFLPRLNCNDFPPKSDNYINY